MSNTLLSPLPSLRLSDDDIPPATATLCRWHPQPRPRPPKPRSFSTPARGPRHARQPKSPTPLPIQAGSSVRERPSRTEPRLKSIDRHCRRRILPRGFLLRGFSDACLHAAPRAVTGRHPKTLNDSGPSRPRPGTGRFDPQRTLGGAGSDAGQCPIATRCEGGSGPHSNTLWAAFDNAESRLGGHERHVVGHYRLGQALEGERAKLFSCDTPLQRDVHALAEQNLAVLGLSAETGGNIAHCADRGVAGALGKTDLAQRRIALRDTGAKTQLATSLAPCGNQIAGGLAHRHRHLDGALGGVGDWHRIVEEHHDPVARELVERAFELADERPQSAMVFAQKIEHFFGLGGLGEGGVAAQIAKYDDDLAAMAFEDFFVALRDD